MALFLVYKNVDRGETWSIHFIQQHGKFSRELRYIEISAKSRARGTARKIAFFFKVEISLWEISS